MCYERHYSLKDPNGRQCWLCIWYHSSSIHVSPPPLPPPLKEELYPFYIYLPICKYLASFLREIRCQGLEVCLLRGSLNGREKEVNQAPKNWLHQAACLESEGSAVMFVLYDPRKVDNLTSGSSAFSKSSLNIWKFMVHVLKSCLENFEHYFARVWDKCNCVVVWTFFGIA